MSSKTKRRSFEQHISMFEDHSKKKQNSLQRNGGGVHENGHDQNSDDFEEDLPEAKEVERQFHAMLDTIELSTERILELKGTSLGHKWNMVKAHDAMQDGKRGPRFYLDQLEKHLNPQLYSKHPSKKMLKGIINVELLLTSLEVDLRSSPNPTWLREFVDEPNCGHIVLLKFLNHVQQCVSGGQITPNGTPKKKYEILSKDSYGFQTILSAPRSLSLMARSLRLNNIKTRTTVLKLLTQACEQPDGHEKVLKAMDDFKMYISEKYRFESLVLSIMTRPCNPTYQQTVLQFLNAIITQSPSPNLRVYYQQEIENAGFVADAVEETLDGLDSTSVKNELAVWREKYIDVATVMDEFVTLRGRTVLLRDEVNLLQSKVEELEKEKNKVTEEKKDLETRVEDFKLRASELQANIEHLKKHRQENDGTSEEVAHALEDAIGDILKTNAPPPPPPVPSTPPGTLPPAPPPPGLPPPPPPPLGSFGKKLPGGGIASSMRNRMDSCAKLPMLNWVPLKVAGEKSVFKENPELDGLAKMIDFKDFEKRFELRSSNDESAIQKRQEKAMKKLSATLNLLSPNKAKNLIIAKRRIGKDASFVQEAINNCDIVALSSEHAELLLKFIPTKDELASLAKHASQFSKFGEAEKFLFQMAKVERYEAKLNTMVYIGLFDELLRNVLPRIEAVLKASLSIASSVKLKRIFEVILLFGNYMNGSRRGQVEGFKLDSLTKLQDTKTNDRSMTFLHYLAEIISTKLPHLNDFHEDFDLENSTKVSLQMIAADVQSLRKGLDLTKAEKDRQPKNFIIFNFYNRAITKVQKVSERYRKMDEAYKEVCSLFGEDPKVKEPSDFFRVFIDFSNQFQKALLENERSKLKTVMNFKPDINSQKQVAREAASVAQNRKSLSEAQMLSMQQTDSGGLMNNDSTKNGWRQVNGRA
ncbi:formin-like protein 1 isoform X2 [Rhopilema esculentum]|uniref:formin-like protein 1 isoform X2 n=1 Tax=Rhopilema esculentum TaxID=499914 RepID=UPI0031DA870C